MRQYSEGQERLAAAIEAAVRYVEDEGMPAEDAFVVVAMAAARLASGLGPESFVTTAYMARVMKDQVRALSARGR